MHMVYSYFQVLDTCRGVHNFFLTNQTLFRFVFKISYFETFVVVILRILELFAHEVYIIRTYSIVLLFINKHFTYFRQAYLKKLKVYYAKPLALISYMMTNVEFRIRIRDIVGRGSLIPLFYEDIPSPAI